MNISLMWFRQDLRLIDNPAFIAACNNHDVVIPLYIYDKATSVLGRAQQWWLHYSLISLSESLKRMGLELVLRQGDPLQIITKLASQYSIDAIYWNRCYEPVAIERDKKIKSTLLANNVQARSTNGSLLNEPWTISNKSGDYFKVFTPFWKHCLQKISPPPIANLTRRPKSIEVLSDQLIEWRLLPINPNWASRFSDYWQPGEKGAAQHLNRFIEENLTDYKKNRDCPGKEGTSKLSPHLHFGEISPWTIWRAVEIAKLDASCDLHSAQHFLSELGWREFSYHLLYHLPTLPKENFRKVFDAFPWQTDDTALNCWKKGETGYPIIDAGMRELWATGFMHNRVRMIVASFLTKDLLIDWRLGADWFLDTLVDADLANNSAAWQWVAGCGADAAPYFRIFNPVLQSEKFDPNGDYIRQWVPELAKINNQYIHKPWLAPNAIDIAKVYPNPIVEHNEARNRALGYYKSLNSHANY